MSAWASPKSACCLAVGSWPPALARARVPPCHPRPLSRGLAPTRSVWDYQMTAQRHALAPQQGLAVHRAPDQAQQCHLLSRRVCADGHALYCVSLSPSCRQLYSSQARGAAVRVPKGPLPLLEAHDQPRNARGRPKTQELPMALLASQELVARAATHDRHLRHGAQPAVAKTTCSNLTDGARPAVKNGPFCTPKYTACRVWLAG